MVYLMSQTIKQSNWRCCRRAAESSGAAVVVHGPIPQAELLAGLGIGVRLEALLHSCADSAAADALRSGYGR